MIWNDRSQSNSRIANTLEPERNEIAHLPREIRELGVRYRFQARHAGQDPWLFLDLRAGRRRVMQEATRKSVLNMFAYTCGIGIAAAKAGARHVVNVDFAESALAVGKESARLNELPIRVRFVKCDAFAALRQFSGIGQPQFVRGKRMPPFPSSRRSSSTWYSSIPALRPEPVRRGRPGQGLSGAVQMALLATAEGHADLLQQCRADGPRGLGRSARAQRQKGRPADPRGGNHRPRKPTSPAPTTSRR